MSQIQASTNVQQVPPTEFPRFVDLALQDIVRVVNGNIEFQNNVKCKLVSVNFSSANTDASVGHGLGKVPAGYIVTSLTANMVVFNGSSGATKDTLTLQSSAPGTAGLLVF